MGSSVKFVSANFICSRDIERGVVFTTKDVEIMTIGDDHWSIMTAGDDDEVLK